jgi:geranylgeranyl diphosphate synthase type I
MLVEAASGQHYDMLYTQLDVSEVTPEMSLRMTELKAGALISGAFGIGASLAGAEARVVEILTRLGQEIGCIAQLTNDVQDVLPGNTGAPDEPGHDFAFPAPKTDLRQRKRTLPIVFALRDDSPEPNAVQRAFQGEAGISEEEMRRSVVEAGGLYFANLVAEVHRQRALEAVEELEALRPGARGILSPILPSTRAVEDGDEGRAADDK